MSVAGTPLEQWPILKRAQVLELKGIGFMTVENVAEMTDLAAQRIGMGGQRLRELAKAYLDDAAAGALLAQATADNERKEAELAELRGKVESLSALCEQLHTKLNNALNAPNPIASYIPAQHDPAEHARMAAPQPEPASSSLLDLPAARPRTKAKA